jgi:hypothetical protein
MPANKDMPGMNFPPVVSGAVFVRLGASLPAELKAPETSFAGSGWAPLGDGANARQIENELAGSGWTLFFMAGALSAKALGAGSGGTVQTAMLRVLAKAKAQGCNCLEVDRVASDKFCGLPAVSVSAHCRLIGKGILASGRAGKS